MGTSEAARAPRGLLVRSARTLAALRMKRLALACVRAAARRDPGDREAWSALGFLLAERGELEAALEAFERARAAGAAHAASEFNAGFILQRLGRHAEALERLRRALALDPDLGRARAARDRSEAALRLGTDPGR